MLVVGIIFLFIGSGVQSAMADIKYEPFKPLSEDKTLYVGGTGPGNYTKIQDAIENASDGDTVFVLNGVYFENININKFGLNLIGENKESTIIDGRNKSFVIQIEVGYSYVNITGFTIQNAGGKIGSYSGIVIFSSYNNITGNIIKDNLYYGIWIDTHYNAYSNVIKKNIIIDNKFGGIFLDWSYPNSIFNNIILNNTYYGIYIGYSILPCSNKNFITFKSGSIISKDYWSYVNRNIIRNNLIGIEIEGRGGIEVTENIIEDNKAGISLVAPYLINCGRNFFYKNNIQNN
jgi:parallel beta-helix repeat protein